MSKNKNTYEIGLFWDFLIPKFFSFFVNENQVISKVGAELLTEEDTKKKMKDFIEKSKTSDKQKDKSIEIKTKSGKIIKVVTS